MKLSAILELLVDAGANTSALIKAAKKWEDDQADALQKRRASDARRQAEKRIRDTKSRDSRDVTMTVSSREGVARVEDNLPDKKISGQEEKKDSLLETEFEREFWPAYPRKVGKRRAFKAFVSARKRASLEDIMAGLGRYAEFRRGEDPQYTKHPEGWLNGDHWTDEPAQRPMSRALSPPHQLDRVNAILDAMQGNSHVPQHPGPTIDSSVERTDWGGAPNLVQLHAVSARGRS